MTRSRTIRWLAIAVCTALPACAVAEHYAITSGPIAAAMTKAGVEILPDQVTSLTDIVATVPVPVLKVRSVQKIDNQRLLARLECDNSDECLPFFVSIRLGVGGREQAVVPATLLSAGLTRSADVRSIVLRAGSKAMLQLDGDHVHIKTPVICMESGAVGQTIRVTDKNHRLVYRAEVMNGALLKGRLP